MPDFRRNYIEGGTYFFTHVTYDRESLLYHPKLSEKWVGKDGAGPSQRGGLRTPLQFDSSPS